MPEYISNNTMITLTVTAVLLFLLPVIAMLAWKKKMGKRVSWKPLFIGAIGFVVSARVLEVGVHMVCIVGDTPVSRFINGNTAAFVLYGIFMAGIFTAYNDWFNDKVYIKSYQMENLNIKSLKSYDEVLFKDVHSQADINEANAKRYEHYHEYYEKVVAKIKNIDFDDEKVKNVVIAYIEGYDKRKDEMINVLFPHLNDTDGYGGNYYGTVLGSVYPRAMLEFDRNELLTYRMILENMYDAYYIKDFDSIFEE